MEPLGNTFGKEEEKIISGADAKFTVGDRVIVCVGEDRYGHMSYLHGNVTEHLGRERKVVKGLREMLMDNPPDRPGDRIVGEHRYAITNYGSAWPESQMISADDVVIDPNEGGVDKLDPFCSPLDPENQKEYFRAVREIHMALSHEQPSLKRELTVQRFLRKLEKQLRNAEVNRNNGETALDVYSYWYHLYPGLCMNDMPNMPNVRFF